MQVQIPQNYDADVVVVGAGISGLVSAWALQQRGVRVLVLESNVAPGGAIGSMHEHGCLLECGPNSALDTNPFISELTASLGLAGERLETAPAASNRYVVRAGRLHALPLTPLALLTTRLFSWRAKLRLMGEPFIGRSKDTQPESVAGFVRRRLGTEFLDYAINPFVGGVYAGNPETLDVAAAFPKLAQVEREYGSLIRGLLLGARARARDKETSKRSAAMFSFRNGMQSVTDAIADRLQRVELSCEATDLARDQHGWSIVASNSSGRVSFRARAVVLAVPAHIAAHLVAAWAPAAAEALRAIAYPPVTVVHSVYRRDTVAHALAGFGMLVPECEGRSILGSIFSSSLFPGRKPVGRVLLTTFVGGVRQPVLAEYDDDDIFRLVHREHEALLGVAAVPEFVRAKRWPRAIPQYDVGHAMRMARLESAESEFPGVFFCANYRGGISFGDCVKSAHGVADRVRQMLVSQGRSAADSGRT